MRGGIFTIATCLVLKQSIAVHNNDEGLCMYIEMSRLFDTRTAAKMHEPYKAIRGIRDHIYKHANQIYITKCARVFVCKHTHYDVPNMLPIVRYHRSHKCNRVA